MRRFYSTLFLILFLSLTSQIAYPQWVQTNGPYGGNINCLAVSGTNIFASSYNGFFFHSTNNGTNWTQVNNGLTNTTINALAVSGTNIFAGTSNDGVYLSTNNGLIWTQVNNGLTNTTIMALAVSGTNIFAGTVGGGVFLSTNNGTNWTQINNGLTSNYAIVWSIAAIGTNIFVGTQVGGVFISTNNGTNWTQINNGLTNTNIRSFAYSGTNIFAGTPEGVFLSTNNGTNWTQVNNGLTNTNINTLAVSGTNIFAGTAGYSDGGVFLSTNNGTSWTQINNGLTSTLVTSLAVSGTNIFAGTTYDGVYLSTNNGLNWTQVNNGLTNSSTHSLAVSGTNIFAGTYNGVYLSSNNGINWTQVNNGLTNMRVLSLAISGTNIFAGTYGGVFLSTNNGTNWTQVNNSLTNHTVLSLALSGANLFAGTASGGVFLSTNNGTNWTQVNNGLTNNDVSSLVVSGTNIFAGTYNGGVFLSTNNGTNWTQVNNGLTNININALAVSGTNIFAGTYNGGVFLSTNNGTNWTQVNNGLTNSFVFSFAISGTYVFAGTSNGGVFLSTNNGTNWTQVNNGLTNSYIMALAVSGTNIFAGTSGSYDGGVWRRPLSEVFPSIQLLSPIGGENWQIGTSHNITWSSSNVTNVKIEYTTDNGTNWATIIASTPGSAGSYSWTIPNTPSAQCKVKISDVSNAGLFSVSAQTFSISTTPLVPPVLAYPPNGLVGVPQTLTFQWNLTTGAHHYELEIYSDAGLTTLVYSTSTVNLFKDVPPSTLTANTTFYWRVRSVQTGNQPGDWSTVWNFRTSSTPGGGVPQPVLSWPAGNAIVYTLSPTLSWYLLTGGSGLTYEIQYSTINNFEGSPLPTTLTSPTLSAGLTGLLPGTQYFWRVRAHNGITNLYSVFSAIESFTTHGSTEPVIPVPSWPTGGGMVYTSNTLLSWYHTIGFPAGLLYDIEINTTGSFTGTPTQSGITGLSTTFSGLTGGQTYHWKVRSILIPSTPSAWSTEAVFVTEASVGGTPVIPIPGYPSGGTTVYSVTPTLAWYLPSGGPGLTYQIELKPLATGFNETGLFTSPTMSYVTTDILTSGVNYHWRVRSTNGVANSDWSAPALFTVSGTISGLPVIPIPSWPVGGALVYSINPLISWYLPTSVPGLTYEIHYGSSSGSYPNIVTSPTMNVSLSGLLAGTMYYYQIRSTDGVLFSSWSTEQTFQTTPGSGTAPSVPISQWPIGGAIVYNTYPTLSWSMNTTLGIAGYRILMSYDPAMSSPWTYTTTDMNYVLSGLIPGQTYYWQVQSYNGSVYSAYSTPVQIFTIDPGSTAPVVPINGSPVAGMQVTTTSPIVSWYIPAQQTGLIYELQYSTGENFSNAVTIENITQMNQLLSELVNGTTYYWRVRSKTTEGSFSAYSYRGVFTPGSVTGVKAEENIIPNKFEVSQNFPNPFNPTTTIKYSIKTHSLVSLKVYNTLGLEVAILVNEEKPAGTYEVNFNASKLSSSVYFYTLRAGSFVETKKLILIK